MVYPTIDPSSNSGVKWHWTTEPNSNHTHIQNILKENKIQATSNGSLQNEKWYISEYHEVKFLVKLTKIKDSELDMAYSQVIHILEYTNFYPPIFL